MGLAASQIQLLTLTARKADCEFGITMDSMQKMTLTREMSQLTSEYNRRLQSKNLVFYNNGSYNPINYNYLMGPQGYLTGGNPVKDDYSMVLTDYNGRVVLNNDYSSAILKVLGNGVMDHTGRGQTFSQDKIPEILAQLLHISGDAESELDIIQTIVDGKELEDYSNTYNVQNSMTGENIGDIIEKNSNLTEKYKALIDFYYPIFVAAANNGWTCEYNNSMSEGNKDYNSNYVSKRVFRADKSIILNGSLAWYVTDDNLTLNFYSRYITKIDSTHFNVNECVEILYKTTTGSPIIKVNNERLIPYRIWGRKLKL